MCNNGYAICGDGTCVLIGTESHCAYCNNACTNGGPCVNGVCTAAGDN